jgi:hypothetical protein
MMVAVVAVALVAFATTAVFASIFTDGLYAAVMVYAVSLLVVESAHWLGLVDRTMKQSLPYIMFQMRIAAISFR